MHREIQIKQFPIVTTHWCPKTRNERFVWENEQYLYSFYLLYTTMSKWSECAHTSGVWRVCARALAHAAFTRGVGVNASRWLWMEWRQALPNWIVGPSRRFTGAARGRSWKLLNFSSANGGVSQSDRLMQIPNPVHATPEKYVIGCCNYDGASAPRFRHALRQALTPTPRVNAAWARARAHTRHTHTSHTHVTHTHTHTSHTGCVCALRSLGHGCVQEVKNDINTVGFLTQTARFVS